MKAKSSLHSFSTYVNPRALLFGYITIGKGVYLAGEALAAPHRQEGTRGSLFARKDELWSLGSAQSPAGMGPKDVR